MNLLRPPSPFKYPPFRYPQVRYNALIADNPWNFDDKGSKSGAERHYDGMTMYEMTQYPRPFLVDDAPLFFWRVGAMQEEALRCIRAWGFVQKSELVWIKLAVTKEDKKREREELKQQRLAFGQGHYVRYCHEVCLICVRDEKKWKPKVRDQRSVFFAERGKHSEKPDEFYRIVRRMVGPGPIAELFARKPRSGYLTVGNEIPGGGVWTP